MKKERINLKGTISSPVDCAKNSNTDQEIEIIEVRIYKQKEKRKIKILRNPIKYLKFNLENLSYIDLYSEEKDSKGVPLLNKIEKYPELPEDVFIPISCTIISGKSVPNNYFINKLGEIININSKKIQKAFKNKKGYVCFSSVSNSIITNTTCHKAVSSTFLINPDINTYNVVNHIDHKKDNNHISNLEWVTPSRNADKENNVSNRIEESKLTVYTAIDPKTNKKVFSINAYNTKGYSIETIRHTIRKGPNHTYKGYKWISTDSYKKSSREYMMKLIGFSGNLKDYNWIKHYKYDDIFLCKEGFVSNGHNLLGTLDDKNYVVLSFCRDGKRIHTRSHRLIVEHILKRDLKDDEIIDHINGVTYDNNIENLRLVTQKENMNNSITRDKLTKKIVVSDKTGDFLFYGTCEEASRYIYGEDNDKSMNYHEFISVNFANDEYLTFDENDKNLLLKKMEKIIYIISLDKSEVLGAFRSIFDLSKSKFPFSDSDFIKKCLNSKNPIRGYYLISGKEAVNFVLSLGHGTALSFSSSNLNTKIELPKSIKDLEDCSEFYNNLIDNSILNSTATNSKSIDKYDLFGNFIERYSSREEASLKVGNIRYLGLDRIVNGEGLTSKGFLWCNSGEISKIKEDLNYIYYRINKYGKFVGCCSNFTGSLSFKSKSSATIRKHLKYLNTGMLAPDGYYYQQGMDLIKPDPTNTELIPKRPILKWIPKSKRDNQTNNDTNN